MLLLYSAIVSCNTILPSLINEVLKNRDNLHQKYPDLCSDLTCTNWNVTGYCTTIDPNRDDIYIEITGLPDVLNSSDPLDLIMKSVSDKTDFDVSKIGGATLSKISQPYEGKSCERGYGLSGIYCVQCGPGSFYDDGEKKCELCDLNKYSDRPGLSNCTNCPTDQVTLQKGSSSINDCRKKCPLGQMLNVTTDSCVPCPNNFYQDQEGKSYCFPCPALTGTINNGSTNVADCQAFCPAGQGDFNGTCAACLDDQYKDKPGFGHCLNCSAERTSTPNNRTACTEIFCDKGRELINGSCTDCMLGFYKSSRGNSLCSLCPPNSTTSGTAAGFSQNCSIAFCQAGSFRNISTNTCFLCARGTYQDRPGTTGCQSCGHNLTTRFEGSTNINQCKLECLQGSYRNITLNHCETCEIGYYQNETDQDNCIKCGTINGLEGSTISKGSKSERDCLPLCGKGYFLEPNSNICTLCPVGEFQNSSTSLNVTACTSCPTNTTTLIEGASDSSLCIQNCTGYSEFNLNSSLEKCVECPEGTYRQEGLREPPICWDCPLNSSNVSSTCDRNLTSHQNVKLNVSVNVTIEVPNCGDLSSVDKAIQDIILHLIEHQNDRYDGLCPTNNCTSDIHIHIDLCGHNNRRKRQATVGPGIATIKVTVNNVSAVLERNTDSRLRSSLAVLQEAFYDLVPEQENFINSNLTFRSVNPVTCGQSCANNSRKNSSLKLCR